MHRTSKLWLRISLACAIFLGLELINFCLPNLSRPNASLDPDGLGSFDERGVAHYAPNQTILNEHAHGNLVGLVNPLPADFREERRMELKIDALGYREYGFAKEARTLLVGGSFVFGSGNTQADNLSQLVLENGVRAYNLGHAGNIAQYLLALGNARKEFGLPGILFVFEGDDFDGVDYCANPDPGFFDLRAWRNAASHSLVSQSLAAFGNWLKVSVAPEPPVIIVPTVPGGPKFGFLNRFIRAASRKDYGMSCLSRMIEGQRSSLTAIVFIPEKSRVYNFLLPSASQALQGESAYAHSLRAIAEGLHIPFLDLTEPLQAEARRLLPQGKFVFWRDDTHWNRAGMQIAVREILPLLQVPKSK